MRTPEAISNPGEGGAGELAALGAEDLRPAKARQHLQRTLSAWPSARSIAVIRREPRNGQAVNGSSIRRISVSPLSLAGEGRCQSAQCRATCIARGSTPLAVNELAAVRGAHLPDPLASVPR